MNYFEKKEENKKKARSHVSKMTDLYFDEIKNSVTGTHIYGGNLFKRPKFIFENTDSVSAVIKYCKDSDKKVAVLNFASFKKPGGMFFDGSSAQEESLCHESTLYNVLREFYGYYEYNNNHKNKALYEDRALYTPDILFERDETKVKCDVITCAAPNKTAAKKYMGVSDKENYGVLLKRTAFLKRLAERENVDTLILGAWGAGVFGQDPKEVAHAFKEVFEDSNIKTIVFAVPGTDENAKIFKEFFG